MPKDRTSAAWYALRRTLPPWSFEQNLRELVSCLPRYKVDEVIVKIDTEEFSHGQPTLEWAKAYQPKLAKARRALEKAGIVYSINPWLTVGHCDRARDDRAHLPGYQPVVGHDGTECTHCACPMSTVWRTHIAALWSIYAKTKPHIIWVEDDIRTFNHAPVSYGCFCPDHLRLFSEKAGQIVTREELVAAILKPGIPHPWRKLFLDMQAEVMIETVAHLAKAVHAVSPDTSLGLMSSGPTTHCLEGRRWKEFASAMADGRPLYSRPPLGNYEEGSLRGLYYSHNSIKNTRFCMPAESIELTEVENVPFTKYSKSTTFTFLQIALSVAYGCRGASLNLFDHAGTPMENDPEFGQMLGSKKTWLNALARACQEPGTYRGVQLLFHEKASYQKQLPPRAGFPSLAADGDAMMAALECAGIPTTYDQSSVVATNGQVLRACSDETITGLLKQGLFLDASAARVLLDRGFGNLIGLNDIEEPRPLDAFGPLSCEEYFNPRFGGAKHKYLTLTLPGLGRSAFISKMQPAPAVQLISTFVDPDTRPVLPGLYAFTNKLGGRVVVSALEFNSAVGGAFNHPFRTQQLQHIIRWLSNGNPSVMVTGGAFPLAFRKDNESTTILGVFNLTLDPWDKAVFEIGDSRKPARIEMLTSKGHWTASKGLTVKRVSKSLLKVECAQAFTYAEPLFIRLQWI